MSCKNLDVISISAKGCGIGIFRKRVVKSTYEKVVDPVIDLPVTKMKFFSFADTKIVMFCYSTTMMQLKKAIKYRFNVFNCS